MTECLLNPLYARQKMAELLFEAYGVPSVAFGTDAMFSHLYNRTAGGADKMVRGACTFLKSNLLVVADGSPSRSYR
jgi:actin-related protein 5